MTAENVAKKIRRILKENNVTLTLHKQRNYVMPDEHYQHFENGSAEILVVSVIPVCDYTDQLKETDFNVLKTFSQNV